ncbi:uncharacterized protein B0P05DRAFT_635556 [Gilbertella persicaria]|uniref:uncharacterized protein n=1 Tax=Gilbertella persicaria TaxID=101096 RepID=UPI002220C99E|nr:uncharacterized protein B0P05DRAFT_635556 [Gilbertella persicaria]KAI8086852.1 hypothetical protein B0P05DRAFT_635556 [Gilbertella persicaria]
MIWKVYFFSGLSKIKLTLLLNFKINMDHNTTMAALQWFIQRKRQNDALFDLLLELDEEEDTNVSKKRQRKRNKENFRHLGEENLQRDYFREDPVEDEATFRRRFRMSRRLYERVKECDVWVVNEDIIEDRKKTKKYSETVQYFFITKTI